MHNNTQDVFSAFISDTGWLFIYINQEGIHTWYPLIKLNDDQQQQYKDIADKYQVTNNNNVNE